MAAISEGGHIALDGGRKARGKLIGGRIRLIFILLIGIFGVICGRLVQLGMVVPDTSIEGRTRAMITATRPPILDRNGEVMAVDIRVPSLFADPHLIMDPDDVAIKLHRIFPDLSVDWLRKRLSGDRGFVWIKRELTPAIEDEVNRLGIPGLSFLTESKRFYPGGPVAAQILGGVNIDNQGIAGVEKTLDQRDVSVLQQVGLARGRDLAPVHLSIDMRVQNLMRDQLVDGLSRYTAKDDAAVMLDIKTGEVLGLVSLPDFDPNDPAGALEPGRFNRITAGTYELGSTFKTITFAGALDSGIVRINDSFDARFPIRFGRFTIDDYHGKHRILTVPEIFKYSSNLGTIRMMQTWGKDNFRAFLHKIKFDDPLPIELPETRQTHIPAHFSDVRAATAAFGQGIAITPLQMASAVAGFLNGGNYVPATIFERTDAEAEKLETPLVSEHTSRMIQYLLRLNALQGSGSRANMYSDGYRIGGKTGTAEKVVDGRYSRSLNFNAFVAAFPMDKPRYLVMVTIDEPHRESPSTGNTAGWNAGEIAGRIVASVAPLVGVAPNFSDALDSALNPPELPANSTSRL